MNTATWTRRLAGAGGVLCLLAGLSLLLAWSVSLPDRLSLPDSAVVRYRDGSLAHASLAPDDRWRIAARLDSVDPDYLTALVAFEDARFWSHPGVDPLAVVRAAGQNLVAGRVLSGASTLTMQVVRLAEPRPRTFLSKGVEALRALQLELRSSKEDVLAAYLALAPFGRNLEGVEAASWAYFGHGAERLSAAEIATLLAVPQNPTARYPSPANRARLQAARDRVAARLLEAGALPVPAGQTAADVFAQVQATAAPARIQPLPRDLPHAVRWLAAQGAGRDLHTSLDRGTQALVERTLAALEAEATTQGIGSAAVVVVDWQTGELRALAGGFDFFADRPGAQIPSFAVPRSPGSALKPFAYAAAIEQGLALPEFLVPDVPRRFGTYDPENYDGRFDGMVVLEEALSRSLNLPFIELLAQLGVERWVGQLRGLGVASLHPAPGHYGLSAVVGGVEVTPLELAGLYATLARGGQVLPLTWAADGGPRVPRVGLSPGAVWLTRRALSLKDRPDFPSRRALSGLPPGIHWKTGTSFGHRDAWAVGSGATHTVAVWLGNLDHTPSRHLVGGEAAGPVLFDVLEGLGEGHGSGQPAAPDDLKAVSLCSLSGHPAGEACPHQRPGLAVSSQVPTTRCPLHQSVEVDTATGLRVAPGCRSGRDTKTQTVVVWPAEVRRWLTDGHRRLPTAPPLAPGCVVAVQAAPRILSPDPGSTALLVPGLAPDEQEIPLSADAADPTGRLDWFVDGRHVGATDGDDRLWWVPTVGEHEVLVQDADGRSDRVRFSVREG